MLFLNALIENTKTKRQIHSIIKHIYQVGSFNQCLENDTFKVLLTVADFREMWPLFGLF